MKSEILLLSLILIGYYANVEAGSSSTGWTNAKTYNGNPNPNQSTGRRIAIDSLGNYWIAGPIDGGALKLGNTISASRRDLFVAKLSSSHANLLAIKLNCPNANDEADILGLAVDSSNNVLVAGWYIGTLQIGPNTFVSSSYRAAFIAKFDSAGLHIWSKSSVSTGNTIPQSLVVDSSNNIYISGTYIASFNIDGVSVPSTSNNDAFIFKLSSAGAAVSQTTSGGSGSRYTIIFDSVVDSQNNIYVTGRFQTTAKFGSTTLSSSAPNFFVAKASSSLSWLGANGGVFQTSGGFAEAIGVGMDASNNVYSTGRFSSGSLAFGSKTLVTGQDDVFITVLSNSLSFLCANQAYTTGGRGIDFATSNDGNVWTAGLIQGMNANFSGTILSSQNLNVYLAKVNNNCVFSSVTASTSNSGAALVHSIGSRVNKNIIVTGDVVGSVSFGSKSVSASSTSLYTSVYSS
jgi:hypothetical protein